MTPDEKNFSVLMSISHRMSHLVERLAFVTFSTVLVVLFLVAAWLLDLSPSEGAHQLRKAAQFLQFDTTWSVLAFLGFSGASLLYGYYHLWRWLYWKFAFPFLFEGAQIIVQKP